MWELYVKAQHNVDGILNYTNRGICNIIFICNRANFLNYH